ncbi:lysophospholipase II [Camillea tinctor]|nr:lysophospholipase II [Camillea tinctor]
MEGITTYATGNDTGYRVEPKYHTHTVIFLHGRDSNAREFADEFFESEASKPENQPRTLLDLFPSIKWVFPNAPASHSERFGSQMSQWFDMWSVDNPREHPELQRPGLERSIEQILDVIKNEERLVPRERIFLCGISQGFATAVATFFATREEFAGLLGLCSWMPIETHIQGVMRDSCLGNKTPVFLSHSLDDDVVPINNGRELRDSILSYGLHVEWREYEDGGHWINEPKGVDDIVQFLSKHLSVD